MTPRWVSGPGRCWSPVGAVSLMAV